MGEGKAGRVVANRAHELLPDRVAPLQDRAHPRALGRRQRDAGILECIENVLAHLDRRGSAWRSRLDAGIQPLVLQKRGVEAFDLLLAILGGCPRLFIG